MGRPATCETMWRDLSPEQATIVKRLFEEKGTHEDATRDS